MVKVIYLTSVHHTGTSFTMVLIGRIWSVCYTIQATVSESDNIRLIHEANQVLCCHDIHEVIDGVTKISHDFDQGGKNTIVLLQGHVRKGNFTSDTLLISDDHTRSLVDAFPTVVSLRDPLRMVLTWDIRNRQNPDKDEEALRMIDSFCFLASLHQYKTENIVFFPVDLYSNKSLEERTVAVQSMLDCLSIQDPQWPLLNELIRHNPVNVGSWVRNLKKYRENEDYGMEVEAYIHSQNFGKLKELLPAPIDYLQQKKDVLRPFLESQGYKDLLWWN